MNLDPIDYREQMKAELLRRSSSNPAYSLRAFARDLGLSPSFVSKVLGGRRDLSPRCAYRVASQLGYSPAQVLTFCELVGVRKSTERREPPVPTVDFAPLSLEEFLLISDWYHYAILYLMGCEGFDPRPSRIGRRLGISTTTARAALSRLVACRLIRKEGRGYVRLRDWISASSERASGAIRNFHRQMIDKARFAVDEQDVSERDISGVTIAIDLAQLPLARREILKFRRRMARALSSPSPASVYQLNIQLFRLSDCAPKRGKNEKPSRHRNGALDKSHRSLRSRARRGGGSR